MKFFFNISKNTELKIEERFIRLNVLACDNQID